MPFNAMTDFEPNDEYPASADDAQRQNILWLASLGVGQEVEVATDYTTTSTSFVDVHASALDLEITTFGNPVLFALQGWWGAAGGNLYATIEVDGTPYGGSNGIFGLLNGNGGPYPLLYWDLSLPAGTFVCRPQWRITAGTASLSGATHAPIRFYALGG